MDQANFTVSPSLASDHGTTGPSDQDQSTPSSTAPNGSSYGSGGATKSHEYFNRLQEPGVTNGGVELAGHAKELCVNKVGHTMVTPREGVTSTGRYKELFKRNRLKTITYCAVFWSFGMGIAFLGPTLLDLECRVASEFSSMSWVFFSQTLFTLLGTACGGYMVQRLGSHLVLLSAMIMLCLTLSIVPECTVLYALTGTLAVMGLFMGTIDTVANISMIQLYGRDVAPFLQALHFFYGLGAFLSPMVTKPFLLNKDCNFMVINSTDIHSMLDVKGVNISAQATNELHSAQTNSKIQYAFWTMSAMQVPVIILLSVLVYRDFFGQGTSTPDGMAVPPEAVEMQADGSTSDELTGAKCIATEKQDEENRSAVTRRQVVMVTSCAAGVLFIYDGLQISFGGYIDSYAVKSIGDMAQGEAAYLNACFWGTFTFGRLLSIGIATRITPPWMLLANLTGCLVAMVMMLSMPHNHTMLYIGTAMFGTFMSSVFPTTVSMTESYINVTSQITSVLLMTAVLGETVLPVIIGHEFDSMGPKVLLVSGVGLTVIAFILYLALYIVANGITRISCIVKKGHSTTTLERGRSQLRSRMSSMVLHGTREKSPEKLGGSAEKEKCSAECSKDEKECREGKRRSFGDKVESPTTKHETVNEKQESPTTKHETVNEKQESPTTKHETVNEKQESLTTKHKTVNEKQESPTTKHETVNEKQESPATKHETVNEKQESPTTKHETVNEKQESPATKHETVNEKQESPTTKHETVNEKQESPTTKHETVNEKQKSLTTKHKTVNEKQESLATKHETVNEKQESLTTKHETVNEKQESLTTKHETVNGTQESLETKHETVNEKQESLKTKHETVNEKQESLKTKHETVNEKPEILGNQKCDKKQGKCSDEQETPTGQRASPADKRKSSAKKKVSLTNNVENQQSKQVSLTKNVENPQNKEVGLTNNVENPQSKEVSLTNNVGNSQRKEDNPANNEDSDIKEEVFFANKYVSIVREQGSSSDKQGCPEHLHTTLGNTVVLHEYENER